MPGERATGGVFLWLPFFAQAKKVTRSPAGRVEALHFKSKIHMDSRLRGNDVKRKELDYTRLLSRALRAMTSSAVEDRCANVRSGILPPQSGFRRNDELKRNERDIQRVARRGGTAGRAQRKKRRAQR